MVVHKICYIACFLEAAKNFLSLVRNHAHSPKCDFNFGKLSIIKRVPHTNLLTALEFRGYVETSRPTRDWARW